MRKDTKSSIHSRKSAGQEKLPSPGIWQCLVSPDKIGLPGLTEGWEGTKPAVYHPPPGSGDPGVLGQHYWFGTPQYERQVGHVTS